MESYIVRIYIRDQQAEHPVRGIVEKVGCASQNAFCTKEELWNILLNAENHNSGSENVDSSEKNKTDRSSTE